MAEKQELSVHLGMSKEEVVSVIGQPLKETVRADGITILRYGSNTTTLADFVFLENNTVILFSTSVYDKKMTLNTYVDELGIPEKSYLLHPDTPTDAQTIHFWPAQGVAITSESYQYKSPAEKIDRFQQMPIEQYQKVVGTQIQVEHAVQVSKPEPIALTPTPQSVTGFFEKIPESPYFLVSVVGIGIVFIIMLSIILIRRRRQPTT